MSNTDQTITAELRSGTTCAGSLLDTKNATLESQKNTNGPNVQVAALIVDAGASLQNYAVCGLSTTNNGVSLGGIGVAYVIVHLLPLDIMVSSNQNATLVMVFSLLISAVVWNLGTWYFGLPVSSSHSLIGSIVVLVS